MARNSVGTPKFYIDAALLGRQWGMIDYSYNKMYPDELWNLNPTRLKTLEFDTDWNATYTGILFNDRIFANSLTHCFILGHQMTTDGVTNGLRLSTEEDPGTFGNFWTYGISGQTIVHQDGWKKYTFSKNSFNASSVEDYEDSKTLFLINFNKPDGSALASTTIGDISAGWSFELQHSPDLELTQSFSNESIKTQTTSGGHTLTNSGWNFQPDWILPAWQTRHDLDGELAGLGTSIPSRRSWKLNFSFLSADDSDSPLLPEGYNLTSDDEIFGHLGIFTHVLSNRRVFIKDDFLSKVWFSTNCGQLPFIFQPDKNVEEYAIARFNTDTISFQQSAHQVYDVSMEITETW